MSNSIWDKKDQCIRELKVALKTILNEGSLLSLTHAYEDAEYMAHARLHGLVNSQGQLLDFYNQTDVADELEHVISKGKGGTFTIPNCIPVKSQHNPRRGYTDEPSIKIKRICKDFANIQDYESVIERYNKWNNGCSKQINLEKYETDFLEAQYKLAIEVDKIIGDFCKLHGKQDPTPNATEKYAKKLRDRKSQ